MNNTIWFVVVAAFSLTLISAASADVYKYRDANGRIVFSDRPIPGAERIDVVVYNPAETPAVEQTAIKDAPGAHEELPADTTYSLTIVSPSHDSTVPTGQERLTIQLALSPTAPVDTTYRLIANGSPIAQRNQPSFTLEQLYRGELTLSAEALDSDGNVIAETIPITVHVKRASRLFNTPR